MENRKCKICGYSADYRFTRAVTRPDLKRRADVYTCRSCGYLFTDAWDEASDRTMEILYKYPEYLEFDIGARTQKRINRAYNLVHYLMRKYDMKNPRILMHGNGSCLSPHWLRQEGLDVWTSFDHLADWDRTVFPSEEWNDTFDLIVSTEVAEHFVHPIKDFKEGVAMLKKGGVLAGSTCFFDGTNATLEAIRTDKFHYTHDYHWNGGLAGMYTIQSMRRIAELLSCTDLTERGDLESRKDSAMPATSYFYQLQKL